ncbi:uncharacterized protein TNCV_680981 [Trichonephila clavipes]|nr:uncharacterized protein TNCV_680981 [Trichonephila clavipes]
MPRRMISAHYDQLSKFERGRIIGFKEVDWANRRIACHMGRTEAAIRRCWQEWCPARLQSYLARSGRNHADWGRVVFSDESRFQLFLDDH